MTRVSIRSGSGLGLGTGLANIYRHNRVTACNATHGLAVEILSVRLSVRLSHACTETKRNNRLSVYRHHTEEPL